MSKSYNFVILIVLSGQQANISASAFMKKNNFPFPIQAHCPDVEPGSNPIIAGFEYPYNPIPERRDLSSG